MGEQCTVQILTSEPVGFAPRAGQSVGWDAASPDPPQKGAPFRFQIFGRFFARHPFASLHFYDCLPVLDDFPN
jgi:hypothetical protein